jgi:hypothetical protein
MKKIVVATKKTVKGFPLIKGHLDTLVALLTILLTLTILVRTVHPSTTTTQTTPTPSQSSNGSTVQKIDQYIPVTVTPASAVTVTQAPTLPAQSCQHGLGPIAINSPLEGDTVTSNPVCISISYQQGNYCSAVWSYNVNNSQWSSYANDQPCFYNLPNGNVSFSLRVKSLVTSDTEVLTRNFINNSASSITSTPVPTEITPTNTPTPATH